MSHLTPTPVVRSDGVLTTVYKKAEQSTPTRVLPTTPTDVRGARFNARLTPGVWNDDADYIYQNGQCLALAVELAKKFDVDVRAAFDSEGELIHAWIVAPNGEKLDGRGYQDTYAYEEELYDLHGEEEDIYIEDFSIDEAENYQETMMSRGLPTQNFDLAATMVDVVIERAESNR